MPYYFHNFSVFLVEKIWRDLRPSRFAVILLSNVKKILSQILLSMGVQILVSTPTRELACSLAMATKRNLFFGFKGVTLLHLVVGLAYGRNLTHLSSEHWGWLLCVLLLGVLFWCLILRWSVVNLGNLIILNSCMKPFAMPRLLGSFTRWLIMCRRDSEDDSLNTLLVFHWLFGGGNVVKLRER